MDGYCSRILTHDLIYSNLISRAISRAILNSVEIVRPTLRRVGQSELMPGRSAARPEDAAPSVDRA